VGSCLEHPRSDARNESEDDVKGRYRVRLTDARGHEVRRIRLPRLWGFIWTDGRYYNRKPGTRTYQARQWPGMVTYGAHPK
jgi:hypothetical protein